MKSLSGLSAAALAAALLLPGAAHAEASLPSGWYAGLGGIASFQRDSQANVNGLNDTVEYHPGWGIEGAGGYAFSNGLRAEFEAAFTRAGSVDKVKGENAGNSTGHLRNVDLFANGYYDISTGTRFTPYVGAGVGVAFVDATGVGTANGSTLDGKETRFAYQGIAGVTTAITNHWALTTDYRYTASMNPKFRATSDDSSRLENASHNVVVGVRYSFGGAAAPVQAPLPAPVAAPVKAPAPVAAPAVPAVPQSYMVFFDFNKATLTPEAKRILAAAAQNFKDGKYVRVVVTGNTDTVGTAKYNKTLSLKRADVVKAELTKLGVTASVVDASGAGKSNLLVPTADGVREAQNRRAEIVLKK